jgi:uncharacterized OsmC-like protein
MRELDLDDTSRAHLLASAQRCKLHNTLKAACPVTITVGNRPSQPATSCCA